MYIPIKEFRTRTSGWMFPKNSILQPMFDIYKLKLYQNGMMQKLQETFLHMPKCNNGKPFVQVNFDFVAMIFHVLVVGSMLAIIIGIGEKIKVKIAKKEDKEEEYFEIELAHSAKTKTCIVCSKRRKLKSVTTQT